MYMDLTDSHNYFDIMNHAKKAYGRMLEPICRKWNLTINELDVILFLANQPGLDRAVDIVNKRGLSKSHVSASIADLESRGMLFRTEDPADRRTVHLSLTKMTDEIVKSGRQAQRRFFQQLHQGVTPEQFAALAALTQTVSENLKAFEEGI